MTQSSRLLPVLGLLLGLSLLLGPEAHAQRTSGAVGLGGQLGEPSGITLKMYNENTPSYDLLAAWSGVDDFFFLNGHVLFENRIPAENIDQPLEWFIGPGAFIGTFSGDGPNEGDAVLGISGTIGLQMALAEHFEIYLQATPRVLLVPETDGDLGGGLGGRYYF